MTEVTLGASPMIIIIRIVIIAVLFVILIFIGVVIANMLQANSERKAFIQNDGVVGIDLIQYFKKKNLYFLWNIIYELFYHIFRIFAIFLSLLALISGAMGPNYFSVIFTTSLGGIGLVCTIITVFINLNERAYIYRVVWLEYGNLIFRCNSKEISIQEFIEGIMKSEAYITDAHYGLHVKESCKKP